MIGNAENVVRVLFPNKILHGKVMGGAFALRPYREESDLSVFRLSGTTFKNDIQALDKGRNLDCAKMGVSAIRAINLMKDHDIATCDVIESGDVKVTSHAGIVTYINSQQLIGGHESEIELQDKHGASLNALILAVQHRLVAIAQLGLTNVSFICFQNDKKD